MADLTRLISINCGSSSIKFSILEFSGVKDAAYLKKCQIKQKLLDLKRTLTCKIEEIGTEYGSFYVEGENKRESASINFDNHETAINYILDKNNLLQNDKNNNNRISIDIVAHRYVHGGKDFKKPLIISDKHIKKLKTLNRLAPLHNPSNLKGVEIMRHVFPKSKHVCIFDTAFHRTIPLHARLYPLPIYFYDKYDIQKFGFHGISYAFINNILSLDGKNFKKLIICHIGNGASICAIKAGKSIDTSMGYTPLEGLMMGTRCGSIDPEIPFILKEKLKATDDAILDILNRKSGLLGISKRTYDFKELAERDDKYSKLALKMFSYRIIKFIGQYAASLDGIDALVFTGGIGENSGTLRKEVCKNLSYAGIKINNKKNMEAAEYFQKFNPYGKLNVRNSIKSIESGKIPVFAIHTDEELQMAFEAALTVADA